jgi:colicin import membrane protein
MLAAATKKYIYYSISLHALLLLILVLRFEYSSPNFVIENTDKHDVISAVVLGDVEKSKILPKAEIKPTPPSLPPEPKPIIAKAKEEQIKKEVIALKKPKEKLKTDLFAKELLADIQQQKNKQKKLNQKQLKAQFAKTLQEQAEQSLRQQLLHEAIKLSATASKQSQGIVNKYKALIVQAISTHWIIPSQSKKNIYCELMIRLAPGGHVIDVQIIKKSGDAALDSSARAAVLKASPLPVPKESAAFAPFHQFALKVKPENFIQG